MKMLGVAVVVMACFAGAARADDKDKDKNWDARSKLSEAESQAQRDHNPKKQLELAKQIWALTLKIEGPDTLGAMTYLYRLATAADAAHDYALAEKSYKQMLDFYTKQKTHDDSGDLVFPMDQLIYIYASQGRRDEADALWLRVLDVTKQVDGAKSAKYAAKLRDYARMLSSRSDYSASIRTYEQAIAIYDGLAEPGTKSQGLGTVLPELAYLYLRNNQEAKGIATYDRAIDVIDASSGIALGKITFRMGVGDQYRFNGRNDLAQKTYKAAITRCKEEIAKSEKAKGDDPYLGDLYAELGLMLLYVSDGAAAEKAYGRAIEIAKKRGKPGAAFGQLAEALRRQGKDKEALALVEQWTAALPDHSYPNFFDLVAADILRELGKPKDAEKKVQTYLSALAAKQGKRNTLYPIGALRAVDVYVAAKDMKRAEAALADMLEAGEGALSDALHVGTDTDHAVYAAQNVRVLDGALSFNVLVEPKSANAARMGLTTLLRRKGRVIDASAAALATVRGKLDPQDRQLLDELTADRAALAKLSISVGADPDHAREIADLEEKIQKLEAAISKKSAAFKKSVGPVELAAIQKLIPKSARLVEFANYEPLDGQRPFAKTVAQPHLPRRYLAYVLGPTGDPELVDLGEAAPIEDAIAKLRKALADPDNDQAAALANAVYALTMGKIAPKLGAAKDIYLAPDGALNVIPFAALVDDKKQFLIARYTFTYLTSGRDLLRFASSQKAGGGGALFADPAFDSTGKGGKGTGSSRGQRSLDLKALVWPKLPGTAAEADEVQKAWKGLKVYRGDDATEAALKKVKGPSVLHLATHGFFLPDDHQEPPPGSKVPPQPRENPMLRAGLALAGANKLKSGDEDGLLTALEASGLDLEGTHIVVLSACETGIGKVTNGDGVYGLRRAFVIAGAESLVMSLWQVDDFATKELMAGFYKKLASGTPRSEALRQTQLGLLSQPKYAHPFFWAAFVAAGATTPLKD